MAKRSVLASPPLEKADVAAIKAVYDGKATEAQQKRAMDTILQKICKIQDEPYCDNERDTTFMLGKARVAREILTLIKAPLGNQK